MDLRKLVIATSMLMVAAFALGQEDKSAELVTIKEGNLPIIITAPHGGSLPIEGVTQRTGEKVEKKKGAKTNFSFAFDRNTDKLAFAIADAIEKQTGKRPYIVVAHFSRKFIDANRPAEDAYESPLAKTVYDKYHDAIAKARKAILAKYGIGLLVDMHGQGSKKDSIFRGTADLKTVTHLVKKFGRDALDGKDGFFGILASKGVTLIPTNEAKNEKENPALNGGWTVRHYGSDDGSNFDAIQLEMGITYRRENIEKTTQDISETLVEFWKRYLVK